MMQEDAGGPEWTARRFFSGHGTPVTIERRGRRIEAVTDGRAVLSFCLDEIEKRLELTEISGDAAATIRALSATAEALFSWHPHLAALELDMRRDAATLGGLSHHIIGSGLVHLDARSLSLRPECLMQRRDNWLADPGAAPYPLHYAMSEGRRHPVRRPKPEGELYVRNISWLDQEIAFRVLTLDDLPLFHRWMNDPRVAAFWQEEGTLDAHRGYLSDRLADPHVLPLIGSFGDAPFGYFEVYWAKENRIGPFYDADDYDRGWHVAVGESAFLGRQYISAWLPSLMHFMFIDDPRTNLIVGEPSVTHVQQIRNLEVSGFARLKTFDFPHKRAALMALSRERFFGDRLWLPARATKSEDVQ